MAIKTSEQANAYAMRMYNEDYWEKKYIPDVKGLKKIVHPDAEYTEYEYRYQLPVSLILERIYVGDDDADQYPDGIPEELTPDDQGKITLEFYVAIDEPLGAVDSEKMDYLKLVDDLHSCVNYKTNATMQGGINLSQRATDHLLYRISDLYLCSDTFNQNKGLLSAIQSKIREGL